MTLSCIGGALLVSACLAFILGWILHRSDLRARREDGLTQSIKNVEAQADEPWCKERR
jgi:hypothetical protein